MNFDEKPYLRSIALKHQGLAEAKVTLIDGEFHDESAVRVQDCYPFTIPALAGFDSLDFDADVTFFVGENGSGKSTLLEAIAVAMGLNAEGGNKNTHFATKVSHSNLGYYLKTIKSFKKPKDSYFLRAESFYNLASYMEEDGREAYLGSYGGTSLHQQSHGESFMATLLHKFRGQGLYLMDEPEAALSPSRQLAALSAIHQLVENKSQFIIATHSPILLAYPRAKIYQFSNQGIVQITYQETEHYQITKAFLNQPEKLLASLGVG
ncbi:SMC protein-like protein [Shewanella denitrificans OS217]|jgi:predicted ATPase|uniref:SMC protein-like protein n=1 Tax=Shewanella denitrificans (strain OS217 / ATCC BAA-1090 / DSM 15013) TaxID=318161 RepID=Q12SN6_SHEDO|nr:AAA family ATPase [Shewanella denitrificans]ABE53540.1 SMC protein-like protein [Shewanella denitrificans OS217]